MGMLQRLGSLLGVSPNAGPGSAASGAGGVVNGTVGVASPFTEGSLTAVAWNDLLEDATLAPVTRAQAMSVPAFARGRHMIVNDGSRCPLETLDAEGNVIPGGEWLQSTRLRVSPQHRMVWTLDDLIHYGWSLWIVQREDPTSNSSRILDAARCPAEWWRFGDAGEVLVKQGDTFAPVPAPLVVLIPGFTLGILAENYRTVRGARTLETQWAYRAANPIPAVELHQTTPDQMTPTEIKTLVNDWSEALAENGGAVAYTPQSVEARVHGVSEPSLLIEGRNAASVDCARILGMPAAMLDATNAQASLTYETTTGRNLEYVDRTLSLWLGPIEARFSLDDVTPPGTIVRANTSQITSGPAVSAALTED